MSFDSQYIFIAAHAVGKGVDAMIRLPLAPLASGTTLPKPEYQLTNGWFVRPVQNTSGCGVFVWHEWSNRSPVTETVNVAVATWPDSSASPATTTITRPFPLSQDSATNGPDGQPWLGPRDANHVFGAAQAGNTIYVAWNNGRFPEVSLPYPHVDIAKIDATSL